MSSRKGQNDSLCKLSLINILSKLSTTPITHVPAKGTEPISPSLPPTKPHHGSVPPSLSTNALTFSAESPSLGLTEGQLRKQSLECLVAVLKSLVAWGTANTGSVDTTGDPATRLAQGEEIRSDTVTPDISSERLNSAGLPESSRLPTPDQGVDDPTKFESAKQKKTTRLEGIKKFNYKAKRVCLLSTGKF